MKIIEVCYGFFTIEAENEVERMVLTHWHNKDLSSTVQSPSAKFLQVMFEDKDILEDNL